MRVPVNLINAFREGFETILADFLFENQCIDEKTAITQKRFMTRSVAPHVKMLSELFNRTEGTQTDSIDTESYWTEGGNPRNRRLAYFLSFMPCNLFRVASVWSELQRLGFRWPFNPEQELRALEWGAGVASGACGIIAGEKHSPLGLPQHGSFALIEQSKTALTLGTKWFETFSNVNGFSWGARSFHRKIELTRSWLPPTAPQFHLFVMSYFLNESSSSPESIIDQFINVCERHLEKEGLIIIVEPALKLQSRKLLQFRKSLIEHTRVVSGEVPLKILLPCLGHQACGALAKPEDWCHEEVTWWRPSYLRELDALTGLDRKSLPFSYLVIQKTKRSLEEILPRLEGVAEKRYRLVSPSHSLSKKTCEFFICGQDGKRRARWATPDSPDRGDILMNTELHGESALTQVDRAKILEDTTLPFEPTQE